MGAEGDGGYLVPDDLEGIEACFSPGIGAKSKFEEDCLSYGIKTYLADASVDSLPINNDQLHFTKKFVAAYNNDSFMTLDSWVDSASITVDSDLLLQMDIEGSEYEVLTNMSENLLKRFRLIVLEVHFLDHLWGVDFYKMASAAFIKILKNHTCVHIHPNNTSPIVKINDLEIAPTVEITFLRNDRIKSKSPAIEFPHPLDADNSDKEAVVLPRNWYQN
ncbi:MAG: FkbM family methyltransferase [Bacteroidetes bacterium]|nr:FkbM family methyltransferase [Bacteroidota bacterium]